MKKILTLSLLVNVLLVAGCGQKAEPASAAAVAPVGNVASFELTANDTMKFSLTRLEVKAGQEVKLTLVNMGNMPKAAMAHNWVLLKKGADVKAFADAAVSAAATEYIPAQLTDQVIAHTQLLGPKQSEQLSFQAPSEPGEYPFLCSFPAHYLTGMKGFLIVK